MRGELSNLGVFLWAAWEGLAPASSYYDGMGQWGSDSIRRRLKTVISPSYDPGDWVHI